MKLIHDSSTYSIHLNQEGAEILEERWTELKRDVQTIRNQCAFELWTNGGGDVLYVRIDDPVNHADSLPIILNKIEQIVGV